MVSPVSMEVQPPNIKYHVYRFIQGYTLYSFQVFKGASGTFGDATISGSAGLL